MIELVNANLKYGDDVSAFGVQTEKLIAACKKETTLLRKKRRLCSKLQGKYASYFVWKTHPIPRRSPKLSDFEDKVILKAIKALYGKDVYKNCVTRIPFDATYRLIKTSDGYEYEIFNPKDWTSAGQGNHIDIYVYVHQFESGELAASIGNENCGALYPRAFIQYDENGDIHTPLGNFNSTKVIKYQSNRTMGKFLL